MSPALPATRIGEEPILTLWREVEKERQTYGKPPCCLPRAYSSSFIPGKGCLFLYQTISSITIPSGVTNQPGFSESGLQPKAAAFLIEESYQILFLL